MRTNDDFAPDHSLPVFLSREAHLFEEPRRSSWLLKAGLSVVAAMVIAAAMTFSLGNPMSIFADPAPTAPPAAQPIADQSTPPAAPRDQSTVDTTQTVDNAPQTADSAPSHQDLADASSATSESQAEPKEPPPGALLKQFQSWAAAQDAGQQAGPAQPGQDTQTQVEPIRPIQDATPQVEPVRPIVQDTTAQADPAQPAQDAATESQDDPAPVRAAQKHRKKRSAQNALAEIRPAKRPRAAVRPDANARADARPPQDPRAAPDQPAQPQSPSFFQSIGLSHQQ